MEILIGTIGTLMFCYVLVNLLIQFTEITIVNLFRIKQIIAYIIAICFCIVPLFLKSEWVLLFSIFIAVYFFVESYIARDDYIGWMTVLFEDENSDENEESIEKK